VHGDTPLSVANSKAPFWFLGGWDSRNGVKTLSKSDSRQKTIGVFVLAELRNQVFKEGGPTMAQGDARVKHDQNLDRLSYRGGYGSVRVTGPSG
jgi:hypothetical protein